MASAMSRTGLVAMRPSFGSTCVKRVVPAIAPRPSMQTSFVQSSSFCGGSFSSTLMRPTQQRGALIVVANAKKSLGCTKQGTRRARARTSGFRARMASATGRAVLAARRKKGRKSLAPASERRSGGK